MSLFFSLFLFFNLFSVDDLGNRGTYEVNVETTSGEQLHLFLDVATYDKLDTIFENDVIFKEFLLNLQGFENVETFTFYKKSYTVKYPRSSTNNLEEEKIKVILPEDFVVLSKDKIKTLTYLKAQIDNACCSWGGQLSKFEIRLLQDEHYFSKHITIDSKLENYHEILFVSYNESFSQKKLKKVYLQIKEEYKTATVNCTSSEIHPIYDEYLMRIKG